MDVKELLKFQVITQMGSGGGGGVLGHGFGGHGMHGQVAAAGGGWAAFLGMFYQMFMLMLVAALDDVIKGIPVVVQWVQERGKHYFVRKVQDVVAERQVELIADTAVPLSIRHSMNRLVMLRVFQAADGGSTGGGGGSGGGDSADNEETNGMVDAVLAHISKLDNVPSLSLIDKGRIIVAYKDKPIQIAQDIYCKMDNIVFTTTGSVSSVKMTLMSNTASAAEISCFVKNVYANYLQEMKNAIGNNIYFFDQKSRDNQPPLMPPGGGTAADILQHKQMLVSTAPKQLNFTMTAFHSNKRFSNIFGKEVREIERRVRFFLENRAWYDEKGVPYQLGLLLSGIPGAGKTSVIRAIANMTKRHIINVNFANISTATQLKNLFFSDKLMVYGDQSLGNSSPLFIPVEQRLYVLEEIDAIGDIVKERTLLEGKEPVPTVKDELTLGEILTVLDGTMESPGRIVVMTTNHPEVLDKALVRPGRIDVKVQFGYASAELIAEMFEVYLERTLDKGRWGELPGGALSPAEVGQVMFRHFSNESDDDEVIADLCEAAAAKRGPAPAAKPAAVEEPAVIPEPEPVDVVEPATEKQEQVAAATAAEKEDQGNYGYPEVERCPLRVT